MSKKITKEGVMLVWEGETPVAMIKGNGHVDYYKLSPMGLQDHEELWQENGQIPKEK